MLNCAIIYYGVILINTYRLKYYSADYNFHLVNAALHAALSVDPHKYVKGESNVFDEVSEFLDTD